MNKAEEILVDRLRGRGLPYTAKYVEMFGMDNMCPSFRKLDKSAEEFYKNCVQEGHPWDWYFEFPEETIF